MIRHVVVHLNIDGTNSAKKDFDVFPHYLNRWKKKSISFDTIPISYKYIILNPLRAKCFKALGIITLACGFPFILNSITSLKAESGS